MRNLRQIWRFLISFWTWIGATSSLLICSPSERKWSMNNLVTLSLYPQLPTYTSPTTVLEWLIDFMKSTLADFFLCEKTWEFSFRILAPFLGTNNIVCSMYSYTFSTYRIKLTNVLLILWSVRVIVFLPMIILIKNVLKHLTYLYLIKRTCWNRAGGGRK